MYAYGRAQASVYQRVKLKLRHYSPSDRTSGAKKLTNRDFQPQPGAKAHDQTVKSKLRHSNPKVALQVLNWITNRILTYLPRHRLVSFLQGNIETSTS